MPDLAANQSAEYATEIYASFSHASSQLSGLVAVDYFFAKEISQCISLSSLKEHDAAELVKMQQQWFHLLIVLSASLRDGHSCLPLDAVAAKCFYASENTIIAGIKQQEKSGFTFDSGSTLSALLNNLPLTENDQQPIVYSHGRLYMRRYYQFEQELKQAVIARRQVNAPQFNTPTNAPQSGQISPQEIATPVSNSAINNIIAQLFPESLNDSSEIDWQALAVANAINKNFAIIAGGPGTGKTYTVTKLLAALIMLALQKNNGLVENMPNIALVAPTGKAAQRLSESIINAVQGFRGSIADQVLDLIPEQAQTLHRLLGVIPKQVNFRHHQENLLAVDVLLIDEVSMVDLPMMARTFRALPDHAKVILLGDADQLPSVAVGNVLADFAPRPHPGFSEHNHQYLSQVAGFTQLEQQSDGLACNNNQYSVADCVTFLMKSRRFDGSGGIGNIARMVINGQHQQSWQLLKESHGVELNGNDAQLSLLNTALDNWLPALVNKYYAPLCSSNNLTDAFALLAKFRILSSTRKGPEGVENLNAQVIEVLRNKGKIPFNNIDGSSGLYPTQPIMITENDYRLGVYNGDIGLLWRNEQGHLMAVFENTAGEYDWIMPSRLPKFETVYAMTIHKTQGSEFEHVAMVLPEQKDNKLLSRELLYTGITRAKAKLTIASSEAVWKSGVSQQVYRYSGLAIE